LLYDETFTPFQRDGSNEREERKTGKTIQTTQARKRGIKRRNPDLNASMKKKKKKKTATLRRGRERGTFKHPASLHNVQPPNSVALQKRALSFPRPVSTNAQYRLVHSCVRSCVSLLLLLLLSSNVLSRLLGVRVSGRVWVNLFS
jgi:hypothetical protein